MLAAFSTEAIVEVEVLVVLWWGCKKDAVGWGCPFFNVLGFNFAGLFTERVQDSSQEMPGHPVTRSGKVCGTVVVVHVSLDL